MSVTTAQDKKLHETMSTTWNIGPTHRYKIGFLRRWLAQSDFRGLRMLDLGCGGGDSCRLWCDKGAVVYPSDVATASASKTQLRCPQSRTAVVAAGENLPYRNASFDAVACLDVLEHCADDAAVVSEVARVLKPRGFLIVTVPADPALFDEADVNIGHFRRYTPEGLSRLLAGKFDCIVASDYGFPVMRAYRRLIGKAADTVQHVSRQHKPSLIIRFLSALAYAAMQVDRLFEGNGRGIQMLWVGSRTA